MTGVTDVVRDAVIPVAVKDNFRIRDKRLGLLLRGLDFLEKITEKYFIKLRFVIFLLMRLYVKERGLSTDRN